MSPRDFAGARRLRALGGLGIAALGLHAALLGELEWAWPAGPPRRAAVSVRTIAAPMPHPALASTVVKPSPVPAPIAPAVPQARADAGTAPAPRRPAARADRIAAPASPAKDAPDVSGHDTRVEPQRSSADPLPAVATAKTVSTAADAEPIPVYPTRPPAPATARYALRRGASSGSADLRWAPGPDGYALQFEGRIGDAVVISQVSEGAFDTAGLAPLRFTDRRQRSRRLATNFRREAGMISYSGSADEHPLSSGAQDRLSWMLQLASIVAAEPARRVPGASVVMAVAGVRGAPDIWAFRCDGVDGPAVDPAGPPTIRFVRESRGLYDSRIEVWLDAAREFLPSRLRMTTGVEAQTLELVFEASVAAGDAAAPHAVGPEPSALALRPDGPK